MKLPLPTLGRIPQFDERSLAFPIRTVLGAPRKLRSYTWRCTPCLNQLREGACVGFAWAHELAARPAEVKGLTNTIARQIYFDAQKLDQWPGENYEGTSVIAGVKAAQMTYPARIEEYRWGFGLQDVLETLSYYGPVVLGINWYFQMYTPDSDGIISCGGQLAGGHAILANGISVKKKLVRLHNSWGDQWGVNGECFISFNDLEALLHQDGEACIPTRRRV